MCQRDCKYRAEKDGLRDGCCDYMLRTGKSRLRQIAEREGVDSRKLVKDKKLSKKLEGKNCLFFVPREGAVFRARPGVRDPAPYHYEEKNLSKMSPMPVKMDRQKARELYEQGKIDREIAAATGVSPRTVTAWRRRHGLPPNGGHGKNNRRAEQEGT